jgi:nucleoside-diphosphate-sugar epimerase
VSALPRIAGARVLVTGGDGLIGAAVVQALAEEGAEVTVYDLGSDDTAARAAGARAHRTGSVTDPEAVGAAVAEAAVRSGVARRERPAPEHAVPR